MSSRRSRPGGGAKYPTPWTAWEWNAVWKCESRYRYLNASGTQEAIEYEYRDPPDSPDVPRNQSVNPPAGNALSTIPESSTSYIANNYALYAEKTTQQNVHGTTQWNMGDVTVQTASMGLGEGGGPQGYYPQQTLPTDAPRRIWTKDPSSETDLDPAFKIHPSWEFKFGRVFKVLWTEPAGSTGTVITGVAVKKAKHGESAYHSIRRFVIVSAKDGHSICLPILTYGGQGCLKRGVHVTDHAVIFTGKPPKLSHKEKIIKKAIRMDPIDSRHKLDAASRVNYAKLYTVEHNVKVSFIGQIARKYEQQVVTDYNATHRPLPDRPYYDGTEDDVAFGHTQGSEPAYSASGASLPAAATTSTHYNPSTYPPTSPYQGLYSSQPQPSYPATTTQYDSHAAYDPQAYPRSAQNIEPDRTYQPAGSDYTEEPLAADPASNVGDPPETAAPEDVTEEPPAADDITTHYEEDLYGADDN